MGPAGNDFKNTDDWVPLQIGDSSHNYHSERHYQIALNQREVILRLRDTRALTYLLLLCQHCVRIPKDPGPW
jgi:hypothetical protein